MVSSWATRIPAIQQQLHLSPGILGLALFGAPVSAVLTMPLISWLASRLGSHIVTRWASLAACIALPLPALASNALWLFLGVAALGATTGAMDVSMNTQAVTVERKIQRSIMSSFHGFFSVGALLGAIIAAGAAAIGLSPLFHLVVVAVILAVIVLLASLWLLADHHPISPEQRFFALPTRPIFALAALAFCSQFAENAIGDWGAVYLHTGLATSLSVAAVGYGAFAGAMMLGRLGGDAFTQRIGPRRAVVVGSSVAAVGVGVGLLVRLPFVTIAGFACFGLGFAVLFPIVISAAGRMQGVTSSLALTAVMTSGYTGMLIGPPLIGGLASAISLQAALGIVVVFCVAIVFLSPAIPPQHD
ncbi:MAG: MFS transporter [Ktedonobacterales bacterium]|nr:MFS transporter [Ktedonobacterales bacterium]